MVDTPRNCTISHYYQQNYFIPDIRVKFPWNLIIIESFKFLGRALGWEDYHLKFFMFGVCVKFYSNPIIIENFRLSMGRGGELMGEGEGFVIGIP